jgi:hypothetical protein
VFDIKPRDSVTHVRRTREETAHIVRNIITRSMRGQPRRRPALARD